tara:strand:+ start:13329 stop:14099 length:771 start_codon:yes stop_codon:yes gene_type:complete
MATIIATAATLWGIIFLFILDGTADPSKSELVPLSWASLIIGGSVAFWIVPEFFVYQSQSNVLRNILILESRPEVMRRRREAEEAASMLGIAYQRRLVEFYLDMDIKIPTSLRKVKVTTDQSGVEFESSNIEIGKSKIKSNRSYFSVWMNTRDSRISRILPKANKLREPEVNRIIFIGSLISSLILLWNMFFGLAAKDGGPREFTIDLSLWISGESSIHMQSPHFDGVSVILTAATLTLVYLTSPASEITISLDDD